MNGNYNQDELKKQNDCLMSQLQLGLAELRTTVAKYPERRNRRISSEPSQSRKRDSIYNQKQFSIKDIKEDIKVRRSSRSTSTPKSNSKKQVSKGNGNTSLSKNELSLLISDAGNCRPDQKRNVNMSGNETNLSFLTNKSLRITPQKKVKSCKSNAKSPLKSVLQSSKYPRTPKKATDIGNLKPSRTKKVNQSNKKSPIKSILHSSKHVKTPNKGNRVCFSLKTNKEDTFQKPVETTMDTTMMGYDWIAGMIDNDTSVNDRSDTFFDGLKEFRKDNWNECKGIKTVSEPDVSTCEATLELSPTLKHTEKENYPLCCKGNGAYMVNTRLNLVPIHGPYSACPTCISKPISQCDADGYVRVSIPRSTIKSPYRLRPHRRKSFDPSDSVSLSMHCLAGWQASKPACIHGPANIDLASHTAKPGLTSVKAMKSANSKLC